MDEPICLEPDEVQALRELISMLATMEDRAITPRGTLEVSRELWRDMVLRPAMGLRRVTTRKLEANGKTR